MTNINDFRKGQSIVTKASHIKVLLPTFPGWGAPVEEYSQHIAPLPVGMAGRVQHVNSHGSNPWTRYSVLLEDGSRLIDGVAGRDFDWVTP
jgi:hypothetical protein